MVTTYPPRRCGIGDYARELSEALAQEDVTVDVLTYREEGAPEETSRQNPAVHRVLLRGEGGRSLWKKIRGLSPQIIHLQSSSFLHGRLFHTFPLFKDGTPLITTVHDAPASLRLFHIFPFLGYFYHRSDGLIVHSRSVKRSLVDFFRVEESRIVELPHGVDIERYRPDLPLEEFRRRKGIEGKFVLLFLGFLRPGKGIETLLEAYRETLPHLGESRLVIAGGVPGIPKRYRLGQKSEAGYPQRLRDLADRMGLSAYVLFPGYVPEEEMPLWLASADLVVFPYLGASQSGPLHRALAAGRPIIATDVGGLSEVLEEGTSGCLVPPKDPHHLARMILRLSSDPGLRARLGREARRKAEGLSWKRVARETAALYRGMIEGAQR
jgi:glycosyltransferase involved in cell wall biosynthesis